jgi:hypothetical protein
MKYKNFILLENIIVCQNIEKINNNNNNNRSRSKEDTKEKYGRNRRIIKCN